MEIALLEDAIREEKQKIAELDKALFEHGVEVKGESSNTVTKVEQQHSNSECDLDNKLDSRTKDSTMPN